MQEGLLNRSNATTTGQLMKATGGIGRMHAVLARDLSVGAERRRRNRGGCVGRSLHCGPRPLYSASVKSAPWLKWELRFAYDILVCAVIGGGSGGGGVWRSPPPPSRSQRPAVSLTGPSRSIVGKRLLFKTFSICIRGPPEWPAMTPNSHINYKLWTHIESFVYLSCKLVRSARERETERQTDRQTDRQT